MLDIIDNMSVVLLTLAEKIKFCEVAEASDNEKESHITPVVRMILNLLQHYLSIYSALFIAFFWKSAVIFSKDKCRLESFRLA